MNNRKITIPNCETIVRQGEPPTIVDFGLVEYLLDNALVQTQAFNENYLSLTILVTEKISKWRGKEQAGKELIMSESQWESLKKLALPIHPTLPSFALAVGKALSAINNAEIIPDK